MIPMLAHCHGFDVIADDGPAGVVETPLFPPDADEPDYLVVRAGRRLVPRFPIVSVALIERVDVERGRVHVAASASAVKDLPERLPIAFP
jgi:hypothetical protein